MNIGKTIKVLRTAAGISQKAFATRLDISASYLSLIESDEREPSVSLLKQVSRLLGVPPSVFFMLAEDAGTDPSADRRDEQRRVREELGQILQRLLTLEHGLPPAEESPANTSAVGEPATESKGISGGRGPGDAGRG